MEKQVPPHTGSLGNTAVPSLLLGRCLQGGASGLRRGLQSIRAGAQAAISASKGVAADVWGAACRPQLRHDAHPPTRPGPRSSSEPWATWVGWMTTRLVETASKKVGWSRARS